MKKRLREWYLGSKEWLKRHEQQVVFSLALVLVGILAFEAGVVFGRSEQSPPLVIEKPAMPAVAGDTTQRAQSDVPGTESAKISSTTEKSGLTEKSAHCRFVGSRNSDKYHHPECSFAKRIKRENIVCFASEEDAKAKGYQAGCLEVKK